MTTGKGLLVTGGTGLLGRNLRKVLPHAMFPSHAEFDVTIVDSIDKFMSRNVVTLMLHAAAYTSPPKVDKNPSSAIEVNVIGTANLVKACISRNIKFIYISTDYVFRGDQSLYKEDEAVYPTNKYAWSKLGGECAVRLYDNSLIVRTSFGDAVFPYEKAFVDQWTSRLRVDVLCDSIVELISYDVCGTVHLGGQRQTVFDYARAVSTDKAIGRLSRSEVSFFVPEDTSLDTSRFNSLRSSLGGKKESKK